MKKNKLPISVIIPSYNSERYIGNTLSSILNQNYSNLEIIIQDGGSTDSTIEIINSFNHPAIMLNIENDDGQYNAINSGMNKATGDILCWLNSDDIHMPWTLESVNDIFNLSENIFWISGKNSFINEKGYLYKVSDKDVVYPRFFIKNGYYNDEAFGFLQQESMFWRREVWDFSSGLNEKLTLAADFALWKSFSQKYILYSVNIPLSAFRIHEFNRSLLDIKTYRLQVKNILKTDKNYLSLLFLNIKLLKYLSALLFLPGYSINITNNKIKKNFNIKSIFKYSLIKILLNAQN
jgi:glycosyltransferase involved in cell wall biosynthesis